MILNTPVGNKRDGRNDQNNNNNNNKNNKSKSDDEHQQHHQHVQDVAPSCLLVIQNRERSKSVTGTQSQNKMAPYISLSLDFLVEDALVQL